MPKPKLAYFGVKGRAEPIKYILAQAGADYDNQIIERADWPSLKSSTPMGQLPYFEDEGVQFCQTSAIARYCGEKYGLTPESLIEKAVCDQFVSHILQDVFDKFIGAYYHSVILENKEVGDEKFAAFRKDNLPGFMAVYEKVLSESKSGYLVGGKVTWADLVAAELFQRILDYDATSLDGYPKVKDFTRRIHELPNIKKHVESRTYV